MKSKCKYNKLKGKIIEIYGTVKEFSFYMNLTPDTIYSKLKGKSIWKTNEILLCCKLLLIPESDIALYFLI